VNVSAFLALLAAGLGLFIAALAWRYRRAPGFRDQGWFAVVAVTAAIFTALNVVTTSRTASTDAIIWCAKAQLFLGTVHAAAWLRYASAFLGRTLPRESLAVDAALAIGGLMLLPGLGFTGEVTSRPLGWLDVVYRDAVPSPVGMAVTAVPLLMFVVLGTRFALAWLHGVRYAGLHVAALGVLLLMALNDALVLARVLDGLYLLDVGFLVPVAAVTFALSGRVVDDARSLARLREILERTVEARTSELGASREALLRAEKLAALGQFSAGVSHEVSSPAAVVAANLRYLEAALREGGPPPDALECLAESGEAIDQIIRLTRQLLDASRLAAAPDGPGAHLALAPAVQAAIAQAGPHLAGHEVSVEVPAELQVLGQAELLAQVLDRLLDNAARAIPAGRCGRITLRAERTLGRVRLLIDDDGEGMTPAVLARAFDPFFSTRQEGEGRGLGLAVARGLLQSLRGDLRLESTPGRGTRAIVELTAAQPAAAPSLTPP
jgi:signal transduction histidine kinase